MSRTAKGLCVASYLLFGVWFGSISYRVQENWDQNSYVTNHLLFPGITVMRTGWLCSYGHSCIIRGAEGYPRKSFPAYAYDFFKLKTHAKSAYIVLLTIFWPVKVLANVSILFLLYGTTTLLYVFSVLFVILVLIGAMLSYALISLFSLLL